MRKKLWISSILVGGVSAFALLAPAGAAEQTIDATLNTSVSMTSSPANVSGWTLGTGVNNRSGGTFSISANTAYTVSVVAERATLTEWNGTSYVAGGASLASPLTITATRTGGTAPVPGVGAIAVAATTSAPLATGTGLGTDDYSLEFSQPTTVADAPLPGANTYHNRITYTASATL